MNVLIEVKKELDALRECGVKIPKKAYSVFSEVEAAAYYDNGMSISDIADLADMTARVRS